MIFETNKAAGKDAVQVAFIDGSVSKLLEKEGSTKLCVARGDSKKESVFKRRKMILQLRKVVAVAKQNKLKELSLDWSEVRALADQNISDASLGETLAVAFLMANFEFVSYKKEPEEGFPFIEKVFIAGASAEAIDAVERGTTIGEEINSCRTLANTPGGDMTPKKLAQAAEDAMKGTSVKVSALGREEMKKLGMGAVLGIGQGSVEEPQFIVMEYWGAEKEEKPLVLIGKGVTFDSGGLDLKPSGHLLEMHMDMSGGAAVIHALALAAKLKAHANVIGLIPAVENMPSGSALRPGDILKSLSGRTIEITDTDAEGRVILSDAITYAKRYNPLLVVEASTLTGAALSALGTEATALMTKNESLAEFVQHRGEESGDYLWPFPQWEEYEDMVKGTFGDVANFPLSNPRNAGVIGGGMFLQEFAKDLDCPFIHLDIAPRMTSNDKEHLAKGAAGAPVRLFLSLVESTAEIAKF